ncbi:hypothetical protein QJS66_06015 [Kocuria rhizophila]|nr:hypothetical protein QJS66_06015 [Kocuria rhizophila]
MGLYEQYTSTYGRETADSISAPGRSERRQPVLAIGVGAPAAVRPVACSTPLGRWVADRAHERVDRAVPDRRRHHRLRLNRGTCATWRGHRHDVKNGNRTWSAAGPAGRCQLLTPPAVATETAAHCSRVSAGHEPCGGDATAVERATGGEQVMPCNPRCAVTSAARAGRQAL